MSATGKILVVDDEERNLRLIEALLAPLGTPSCLRRTGLRRSGASPGTGPTWSCWTSPCRAWTDSRWPGD